MAFFSITSICRDDAASMDMKKPELRHLLVGGAGGSARRRRSATTHSMSHRKAWLLL